MIDELPALIFADTSPFIAAFWQRDPHHARAAGWQQLISASRRKLLTTEGILDEFLNALANRNTRLPALAAYQHILADTNIEVVEYSESLRDAAIDLYQKSDDKD